MKKVVAAIEAGAVSYVLKTVSAEELIYALNGAVKGMPVMTADVSQALTRGLASTHSARRRRRLNGAGERKCCC